MPSSNSNTFMSPASMAARSCAARIERHVGVMRPLRLCQRKRSARMLAKGIEIIIICTLECCGTSVLPGRLGLRKRANSSGIKGGKDRFAPLLTERPKGNC